MGVELCILRHLNHGWVTATCHLHDAVKREHATTMQRVRRLLRKMSAAGFVKPVSYSRSGRIYHWQITDAGRIEAAKPSQEPSP